MKKKDLLLESFFLNQLEKKELLSIKGGSMEITSKATYFEGPDGPIKASDHDTA